ncbi:phage holin family protein [Marisediminicola sp. LYQ134]|uniref:phage holin family protein n=1 Tax=unclassified Marisediminicola TaxID=2618316 RepID=UPI00398315CE
MSNPITPKPVREKRSLFQLIADIPTLVTDLVKGEIDQLKAEMIGKLKALGIGGGLLAAAGVVLLYMVGVLLTAAILGLAVVMPAWLAALIVAFVLLVIAAIIGLIGYRKLKGGIPPVPTNTIDSVKRDIDTIKGMAK